MLFWRKNKELDPVVARAIVAASFAVEDFWPSVWNSLSQIPKVSDKGSFVRESHGRVKVAFGNRIAWVYLVKKSLVFGSAWSVCEVVLCEGIGKRSKNTSVPVATYQPVNHKLERVKEVRYQISNGYPKQAAVLELVDGKLQQTSA